MRIEDFFFFFDKIDNSFDFLSIKYELSQLNLLDVVDLFDLSVDESNYFLKESSELTKFAKFRKSQWYN